MLPQLDSRSSRRVIYKFLTPEKKDAVFVFWAAGEKMFGQEERARWRREPSIFKLFLKTHKQT